MRLCIHARMYARVHMHARMRIAYACTRARTRAHLHVCMHACAPTPVGDIRALKAGERPPPRRMSGVRRVSSDGGRRLSTDGGVVSRPSVVLMAPQPSSTFAAAPGVAGAAFSTSQPNQS